MLRSIKIKFNCLIFAVGLWFNNRMKSSLFVNRSVGLKGLIPHFGHMKFKNKLLIIEDYIPRKRKTNFMDKGDSFLVFDGVYRTRVYELKAMSVADSLFSARKETLLKLNYFNKREVIQ